MSTEFVALLALTFLVALVYSSVGHGGASGYLALLSFYSLPHEQMSTSALSLNLLVAGTAFWMFLRAFHFSWKLTWPFTLTSIPFAFVGGLLRISPSLYALLLGGVLLFAVGRLLVNLKGDELAVKSPPPFAVSLPLGGGVGLLSGIVGVGGGIFLSPILLIFHWAGAKRTAATSAFFILVNSFAGLLGRFARQNFVLTPFLLAMVLAAFLGGIVGSQLGANHFSGIWLRRILAVVLFAASFKLFRPLF